MGIFSKNKVVETINQPTVAGNTNEEVQPVAEIIEKPNSYIFIAPLVIGAESTGEFKYLNEVSFREPTSGDLRGLTLVKIFESDVDSWLILLNRITTPNIPLEFLKRMNLTDMSNFIAKVLDFLPSRAKATNTQAK